MPTGPNLRNLPEYNISTAFESRLSFGSGEFFRYFLDFPAASQSKPVELELEAALGPTADLGIF